MGGGTISTQRSCKREAIAETSMTNDAKKNADSIAGLSASHFITKDDSLASLLLSHRIEVRDFMVLSFLSDQGSMSILRLSRVVGIEPQKALESIKRLSAVSLVLRSPTQPDTNYESVARLTARGERIAAKVNAQLD